MAIRDLSDFFLDGALVYPGVPSEKHPDGKTYTVKCVDARTGVWLESLVDVGAKRAVGADLSLKDVQSLVLDDDQELSLYQRLLGPVYQELIDDNVSKAMRDYIHQDVLVAFSLGIEAADNVLAKALANRGNPPAAPEAAQEKPKRATRSTARKTAGSKSGPASTATRGRTRARASTRSSTSPTGPAEAEAV